MSDGCTTRRVRRARGRGGQARQRGSNMTTNQKIARRKLSLLLLDKDFSNIGGPMSQSPSHPRQLRQAASLSDPFSHVRRCPMASNWVWYRPRPDTCSPSGHRLGRWRVADRCTIAGQGRHRKLKMVGEAALIAARCSTTTNRIAGISFRRCRPRVI